MVAIHKRFQANSRLQTSAVPAHTLPCDDLGVATLLFCRPEHNFADADADDDGFPRWRKMQACKLQNGAGV
jgi:hypothetical protein